MLCLPAALVCIAPVRGPNGLLRASTRGYLLAATGVVALVSFLGAALCASLNLPCNLIIGAVMPLFFLLYRHYVDLGWLRALFVFLLAAAAMAFCAVLTDVLLARLEVGNHSGVPSWPSATVQFALGLLTALMLCPILSRKLAWLLRAPGDFWKLAWIFPLAFLLLFMLTVPQDYSTILVNRVQKLGVVLLLFLMGVMVVMLVAMHAAARSFDEGARLREENRRLAMQAREYAALNQYMRATRKLRRDFRQHLRVLDGLAAEGRLEDMRAYLREVAPEAQDEYRAIFANPALNALAGHYDAIARARDVAMDWRTALPESLPVPEAELCVLLGNLLENAVDDASAMEPQRRYVRAICRMNGDMLCIIVENGYAGELRRAGGRYLSTKHEGEGDGLASVEAVAKRHSGSVRVEDADGVFRVSVLLNGGAPENAAG